VIGGSDAQGAFPASRPLTPGDLLTTLYTLLGISTEQLTGLGLAPPGTAIEELV
jgi:hypothetical protein